MAFSGTWGVCTIANIQETENLKIKMGFGIIVDIGNATITCESEKKQPSVGYGVFDVLFISGKGKMKMGFSRTKCIRSAPNTHESENGNDF